MLPVGKVNFQTAASPHPSGGALQTNTLSARPLTSQVRLCLRAPVRCVHTYTLDGVGTGGPDQHRDSVVLFVGVHLQPHLVGRHAEGGDHLADAAGERVPEGDSDITADIMQVVGPMIHTTFTLYR